jgi:CubicO group peptidase (beta-lactamase class C family)
VRQLLGHEAGLVLLDEQLTIEKLRDFDYVARVLARQKPAWTPGTRHGYHTMTVGLYMQELIRRVDPAHRTLGRFFHEEIAGPLDLEFYIGLPRAISGAACDCEAVIPRAWPAGVRLHAPGGDLEDDPPGLTASPVVRGTRCRP